MKQILMLLGLGCLVACGATDSAPVAPQPEVIETAPEPEPPAIVIDITGEACGGASMVECPGAFYCEQPLGECLEVFDGAGTCQPEPEMCTRDFTPVCGCNGQTYSNACEAAAAGISIAAEGECATLDTL